MLLVIAVSAAIITALGWFFGRTPEWFETKDPYLTDYKQLHKNTLFYPYGYTSKGKKRRVMPWQLALVVLVIAVLYYLAFANQVAGLITISVIGGVLVLALLVFGITENWNNPGVANARAKAKAAWDKACPPLVIVEKNGE